MADTRKKRIRKVFLTVITVCMILGSACLCCLAQASEAVTPGETLPVGREDYFRVSGYTKEDAEALGILKVGYVQDRIPISFRNSDGELAGVTRYILDRIQDISGMKFEYAEIPDGSVTYDVLTENGYDLITSVEFNRENLNARGILISEPYLSSRKVVVGKEDLVFDNEANLRAALSTGSQTLKRVLKEQYPNFDILDYDTLEDCFDAVRRNEADLLIINQYVAEYWLGKPKYEKLKVIPVIGMADELCFSAVIPIDQTEGPEWERAEKAIDMINQAIALISEDEITGFLIRTSAETPYKYNFSDFVYRYRYAVTILILSLIIITALLAVLFHFYMRAMNDRAELKARGKFLSTMSHEIRTPINGLAGLNYLMTQNLDDKEKLAGYLHQSSLTMRYLLSLVNDILDMSRLQENEVELTEGPFSLNQVLAAVTTMERRRLETKGVAFKAEEKIPYPDIIGDEIRVEQILINILDNACKFTPEGGEVRLKAGQEPLRDGKVLTRIEISDTGCGMSEEFVKKVFDTFTQERKTVSKGTEGTGLGMSISYRLAKLMGGDLTVESTRGKGSCFTLTFPAAISEARGDVTSSEKKGDGSKRKVLIAEDNELNGEILSELLIEEGFDVALVTDGKQAVERFTASEPGEYGIILMDLLMPVKDGFEAAKEIRRLERPDSGKVKIFACTANSLQEDREKALASGMDDFITKPVDVEVLMQKLKDSPD